MQANRRRAADVVTTDRHESNRVPVAASSGIDGVDDAEVLNDAGVLDLMESIPVHELRITSGGNSKDLGVQQSDELETIGTRAPVLTAIFTAAALILITTIAFASVAYRAPDVACILFLIFVVASPVAVASVIREEARLKKTQNTPPSQSPERT
jgi:hypothetical protein